LAVLVNMQHTVEQLGDALRYKSDGRGVDSSCCQWNFSLWLWRWLSL